MTFGNARRPPYHVILTSRLCVPILGLGCHSPAHNSTIAFPSIDATFYNVIAIISSRPGICSCVVIAIVGALAFLNRMYGPGQWALGSDASRLVPLSPS